MKKMKRGVGVIPLGDVPFAVLESLASHIDTHLQIPSEILPGLENPSHAMDAKRRQYNAAAILKHLENLHLRDHLKVVGVLNVDLFIPVFTHVFGEAREGGHCALVSLYRLRKNSDGSDPSLHQILERAAKVALHELAHLFDVPHCRDSACLMHFSMNLNDLDRTPMEFCRYCRAMMDDGRRRW
jgi:archaemetzincin